MTVPARQRSPSPSGRPDGSRACHRRDRNDDRHADRGRRRLGLRPRLDHHRDGSRSTWTGGLSGAIVSQLSSTTARSSRAPPTCSPSPPTYRAPARSAGRPADLILSDQRRLSEHDDNSGLIKFRAPAGPQAHDHRDRRRPAMGGRNTSDISASGPSDRSAPCSNQRRQRGLRHGARAAAGTTKAGGGTLTLAGAHHRRTKSMAARSRRRGECFASSSACHCCERAALASTASIKRSHRSAAQAGHRLALARSRSEATTPARPFPDHQRIGRSRQERQRRAQRHGRQHLHRRTTVNGGRLGRERQPGQRRRR